MNELSLAAPISYSNENNSSLLGLLKNYAPVKPLKIVSDTLIPYNSSLDVEEIIRQNDKRMPRNNGTFTAEDLSMQVDEENEDDAETGADEDVPNWKPLDRFLPQNRLEQINTVLLQDFPSLRKRHFVRCIELFLSLCPLKTSKSFVFSYLSETIGQDKRSTFIRFLAMEVTKWVKENVALLFPSVVAAFDSGIVSEIDSVSDSNPEETHEESSLGEVKSEIENLITNKRNYSYGSKRTGTEDLDEVMKYYRTYKVENSELVDVPKEMKEVIVQDILKFRSKVLTIERERRKREIEQERKRARNRLTLIYEGIQAAPVGGETVDTELEEVIEADPLDSLSDAQYEEHLKAEKKRLEEEQWRAQLAEIERLEASEKDPLVSKLEQELGYEEALIENKINHMDEIKVLSELDPITAADAPSSRAKLYFTNNAEYIRRRNQERVREEEMDALDEKRELEEEPHVGLEKPAKFVAAVLNQAKSASREVHNSIEASSNEDSSVASEVPENSETSTKVEISAKSIESMPSEKLAALEQKISDLVEEYLGIKEDLLVEFIYDFVVENNTEKKEDLITELQETLDEDSATLVEELHKYIHSL